ncbi:MAG: AAA family ATPase [Burkholderiales bacterium]|nr:AAA family ATPase [Burkholderiales bacterium]
MQCSRCQHENPPQAKFCPECGARLALACFKCRAELPAAAKFCLECGHPVAAQSANQPRFGSPEGYTPKHLAEKILTSKGALEGERKLVTVLFADLKASMELLAESDPEEARNLLDPVLEQMMEAVHRYEGTVNQVMGDGIMALFGAPLALEDHAVRAGYAALRMQETVKRYAEGLRREKGIALQIRVGLNSGEVVVRSIGSDLRMDYTAVGQTTHLAARMEQLASPGSIFLTRSTLELVEGFVAVKPLGPVPVKGLASAVEVYEMTGAGPARTRLQAATRRGLTRFVGRDAEVEQLRRALDRAAAAHGQVAAVVGEAGVGKSRLLYEFIHSHRTQGWLNLESGSVSYGKATAYLPVIGLLQGYFKIQDRDDRREIRDKVIGRVLGLDRSLEPLLPPILALLDVPVDDPGWQALDSPQRRQRTLDAVKRLLLRESQVQPLLLVIEDLHWIDSETQALLDSLVDSLGSIRVLLLVSYRPEYAHQWGKKTYYTQLRLESLPPEGAGELLHALLGDAPALEPLKHMLRRRGNPLFLEETIRTLVETKALEGERGAYRLVRPVQSLQIPATVQTILAARIDRLPVEEKQLLQIASVIGKDVPYAILTALAELPEEALQRSLGHLQEAEFLYETSLFPDPEYTFKHALTHEVTYGSLLQDRRRTFHGRIVGTIEQLYPERLTEHVERIAHHAFRGEVWDKALTFLRQAGAKAFVRSANREAVAYFEQALAALSHLPETRATIEQAIDLRFDLRASLFALMDLKKAFGYVREAEHLARAIDDQHRLARAFVYTSHHILLSGDAKEARALSQNAHAIAQSLDDLPLRVVAELYSGATCIPVGSLDQASEHLERTLQLLPGALSRERFGLHSFPVPLVGHYLCWALAELGEFDAAIARGKDAIQVAEEVDHAYSVAVAQWGLAYAYFQRGDLDPAVLLLERTIALCRDWTVPILLQISVGLHGIAIARSGEATRGISILREAYRGYEESIGMGNYHTLQVLWLGEACARDHQHKDAIEAAVRALELSRQFHHATFEGWALRLLGEIELQSEPHHLTDAEDQLQHALALGQKLGMRPLVARCHADLARLCRRSDRGTEADQHLQAATTMYREMGMKHWQDQLEAELAVT